MYHVFCHGCGGKGWVIGKYSTETCPICKGTGLPHIRTAPIPDQEEWRRDSTGTPPWPGTHTTCNVPQDGNWYIYSPFS